VLCALGYSGADFLPEKTDVSFNSKAGTVQVCKEGEAVDFSEEKAKLVLSEEEIEIFIKLREGNGRASVWGCDLTYTTLKLTETTVHERFFK
jgi:glutamate N-acetyltransferase/amino-acid N-acetyltransferase